MNEEITASEYQRQATRTLLDEPGFEIPPKQLMLLWNVLGLVGEVGEILEISSESDALKAKAKFDKEVGDALWYAAAICTKLGRDLKDVLPLPHQLWYTTPITPSTCSALLSIAICVLAEYLKKGIFHRHGIDENKILILLQRVLLLLFVLYHSTYPKAQLSMSDLFQGNLKKLHTRYHTNKGFTSEDSIKRVDVLGDNND